MNSWRITKYNPTYRDERGSFTHDDWTSIYDIGKSFGGDIFTFDSYLNYENAYINAVQIIMNCNGVHSLIVEGLEKSEYVDFTDLTKGELKSLYYQVKNNFVVTADNIELVVRLILREVLWCKLISRSMFVHFGYDFYMYISSNNLPQIEQDIIKNNGLFIEEMNSPYL